MNWPHWVIPLIAILVWILANLTRLSKEAPSTRPRRAPLPPRPPVGKARPATPPPATEVSGGVLPSVLPVDKPATETGRALSQSLPEALPLSEPVLPAEELRSTPKSAGIPTGAEASSTASPAPSDLTVAETITSIQAEVLPRSAPPPAPMRRVSRTARRVLALLRDPETLAAGVLLHEILQPPLCRRPRFPLLRPLMTGMGTAIPSPGLHDGQIPANMHHE